MKINNIIILFTLLIFFATCKQAEEQNIVNNQNTEPVVNAIKIACIGNSITEGNGIKDKAKDSYPAQLQQMLGQNYEVQNFGVSGRTLLRKGDFPYWNEETFRNAKDFQPDVVVIKLGTNDTKPQNWKYADEFVKDYKVFIDEFRALDSSPKIYICYPVPAFEIKWGIDNKIITGEVIPFIDEIAEEMEVEIIDLYTALDGKVTLFPDAIHPNKAGAKVIATTVAAVIKD